MSGILINRELAHTSMPKYVWLAQTKQFFHVWWVDQSAPEKELSACAEFPIDENSRHARGSFLAKDGFHQPVLFDGFKHESYWIQAVVLE